MFEVNDERMTFFFPHPAELGGPALLMGFGLSILTRCGLSYSRQSLSRPAQEVPRGFGAGCPAAAPFVKTGLMHLCVKLVSAALPNPKTVAMDVHCHGRMPGGAAQTAKQIHRHSISAWPQ
jgi:hypothetical protein